MLQPSQAAQELLARRRARAQFLSWCQVLSLEPALHHRLLISELQRVSESTTPCYVIILMPPGSAKSTYSSKAFPPWYLGKNPGNCILACSYAHTLAAAFGRAGRDLVSTHENILGYSLKPDTKAADEWETTNGGRYFCAGVGAGIAGHRADLGLIDDYLGTQEDADSLTIRNKQHAWFINDFYPRLKPNASIVIIANRRNEDDLVGRLLDKKRDDNIIPAEEWKVIKLPFFAKENDPLGRAVGDRLWPEWFTAKQADQVRRLPTRSLSGLYQQEPAPEEGDFFKKSWFIGYQPHELPPLNELSIYAASDHAVSKKDDANKTCFGVFGVDCNGDIWWLPEGIYWQRADSLEQANEMLRLNRRFKINYWYAEKGHIAQSIGPFLFTMMREQKNWINLQQYTPKKDKATRARSIQGIAATGRLHVPKFKDWWVEVESQLLSFPASSEDDVVDMLAHLGKAIDSLGKPEAKEEDEDETLHIMDAPSRITLTEIKSQIKRRERRMSLN